MRLSQVRRSVCQQLTATSVAAQLRCTALAFAAAQFGCAVLAPVPHEVESIGAPARGALVRGSRVADNGVGYQLFRTHAAGGMVHTTQRLHDAVQFAARRVALEMRGSVPLRVGDFSAPFGGQISRHRSHRNGRDVDILFFALDATATQSVPVEQFVRYKRDGSALPEELTQRFDDARNWLVVESLLSRDEFGVVWIFCADWLKQRLLQWALAHGRDARMIERARRVLHQPGDAAPHDDHFHVRVACTSRERLYGCIDGGPEHWWLRRAFAKIDAAPDSLPEPLATARVSEP